MRVHIERAHKRAWREILKKKIKDLRLREKKIDEIIKRLKRTQDN
jgi:3-hydroxyacyl-CoA dehydrogenase